MIFLTVGSQFGFERLVKSIDEIVADGEIEDDIYGQIGLSSYTPSNFKATSTLDKNLFDQYLSKASHVIGHAGMGTIITALDLNKPLLVMPRLHAYREVVNDHQVFIAREFEQMGHILVAYNENELAVKINELKYFSPKPRSSKTKAVTDRIIKFLNIIDA